MSRKKRPSIYDVAKVAGVSSSTVSRVLNQKEGDIKISEETQKRVMEAVNTLGYQRNPFAFAARVERTGIVGAVLRNIGGTSNGLLARRLQFAAKRRNIEILIGMPHQATNEIERQMNILQTELFDGLMFLGDIINAPQIVENLRRTGKPYVFVGTQNADVTPLINANLTKGMEVALDYLHDLGHDRIGFLGSPVWVANNTKLQAFVNYHHAQGWVINEHYISDMGNLTYSPEDSDFSYVSHNTALDHAKKLIQRNAPPTAIVCASDGFAVASVKAAAQCGLHVPEDISIVGFGADRPGYTSYPELTMMQDPHDQMVERALDLLQELMDNPSDELLNTHIALELELVVRETTTSPASRKRSLGGDG